MIRSNYPLLILIALVLIAGCKQYSPNTTTVVKDHEKGLMTWDSLPEQLESFTDSSKVSSYLQWIEKLIDSTHQFTQALTACDTLITPLEKQTPKNDFLLSQLKVRKAKALANLKNFAEAETLLNDLLSRFKDHSDYHFLTGYSYTLLGETERSKNNFPAAKAYFLEALPYLKLDDSTSLKLGLAYYQLGTLSQYLTDYEGGIQYLRKALSLTKINRHCEGVLTSYEKIAVFQGELGAFQSVLTTAKEAALSCEEYCKGDFESIATVKLLLAGAYNNLGDKKNSQKIYLEILQEAIKEENNHVGYVVANNLAGSYLSIGDYHKSIHYYQQSFDLVDSSESLQKIRILNNLTGVYFENGDYEKALKNYKRIYALIETKLGKDNINLNSPLFNIGVCHIHLKNFALAQKSFQQCLDIRLSVIPPTHPAIASVKSGLANAYTGLNQFDKAIPLKLEALQINEKNLGLNHIKIARNKLELANIYAKAQMNAEAEELYQAALQLAESLNPNTPLDILDYYEFMADFYRNNDELEKAITLYEQSSQIIENSLKDLSLTSSINYIPLIRSTHEKAKLHKKIYLKTGEKKQLALFTHSIQKAENLLTQIKNTPLTQSAQKDILSQYFTIYEDLISTNTTLSSSTDFQELFRYFEKSKSFLLSQTINDPRIKDISQVPDSILSQQKERQLEIALLEKKYFEEKSKPQARDSILNTYTSKITELQNQFELQIKVLVQSYPDYYNLKYNNQVISISGIQDSLLTHGRALLEYFVGDSTIFAFVITPDTFAIREIKKDFPLEEWVNQLRCGIFAAQLRDNNECNILSKEDADALYVDAAQKIYQNIFAPVDKLLSNSEELIVVPDGILGYLPFDALIRKSAAKSSQLHLHDYLLNDFRISYAYSATLLHEIKYRQYRQNTGTSFIGYAPNFKPLSKDQADTIATGMDTSAIAYARSEIGPLKYNIPEVQAIQAQIGGNIYTDTSATREAFLASASDARILHLSTHGKANDKVGDYSFLAFYQHPDSSESSSRLYNRDLYNLHLNADMVVLSACETGIGELQRGEGIISMARGFSYAGAKSIVTTLWSVDDESSSKLMTAFYRFLKEGKSKDAALKAAKLELMKNPQYASPYHWAGVIPIGDMTAIELQGGMNWKWIVLGGICLLFILMFFLKFQRRESL